PVPRTPPPAPPGTVPGPAGPPESGALAALGSGHGPVPPFVVGPGRGCLGVALVPGHVPLDPGLGRLAARDQADTDGVPAGGPARFQDQLARFPDQRAGPGIFGDAARGAQAPGVTVVGQ